MYTTAGTFNAKVTVSDGKATVSKTLSGDRVRRRLAGRRGSARWCSRARPGFRHDSIPAGIAAIKQLGTEHNFQVDATEDPSIFNDAALAHYQVVVFLSTTGDPLNDTQQAAFERYIRGGGGYVGIHAAADTEYTWTWYGKLVGAYFRNHPAGTPEADVLVEDLDHHSTKTLPARWHRTDEWYNYQAPDGAVVGGGGTDFSRRGRPASTCSPRWTRARTTRTTATRRMTTIRSRGASATTAAARGTRAWVTPRPPSASRCSSTTCSAGSRSPSGVVPDDDCGNGPANQAPTVSALRNPCGRRPAGRPGGLHLERLRSGRRHADVRVGLRRRRHRDHQGRDAHLRRRSACTTRR